MLKILRGIENNIDHDQRSSLIWVCTVCLCHFVRYFGIQILGNLPKSKKFKGTVDFPSFLLYKGDNLRQFTFADSAHRVPAEKESNSKEKNLLPF